jgi:tetratricopeptide (TPR) repeat protein
MVATREPVAAEASLRLGQNYVRLARPDLALPALGRAESLGTTPYELYLARLFAGAALARTGRRTEAITALRGALEAVPRAQAASFALAPMLLELDARADAAALRPVTGLAVADFDVNDNGIPQTVERAFTDLIPIDVTVIIDASGSTASVSMTSSGTASGSSRCFDPTTGLGCL